MGAILREDRRAGAKETESIDVSRFTNKPLPEPIRKRCISGVLHFLAKKMAKPINADLIVSMDKFVPHWRRVYEASEDVMSQVLREPVHWNHAGIHRDAVAQKLALKEMSTFDPERYDAVMRTPLSESTNAPVRFITRKHVKSHNSHPFFGLYWQRTSRPTSRSCYPSGVPPLHQRSYIESEEPSTRSEIRTHLQLSYGTKIGTFSRCL